VAEAYQVVRDATESLQSLLLGATAAGGVLQGVFVEAAVPYEGYTPAHTPALTLFLYQVLENTTVRNRDRTRMPDPNAAADNPARFIESEPPMGLELHYLLIPWHTTPLDEHELLGRAMHYLYGNRAVHAVNLAGYLREQEATLAIQLQTETDFSLDQLSRLWDAMGRSFKLSLSYRVRGVYMESPEVRGAGRVLDRVVGYREESGGAP
jgi:hypothetical protein